MNLENGLNYLNKDEGEIIMNVNMLKSKIHRAIVTQAELDYVGSITIDKTLMESAGIMEYEKVLVVDVDNGNRLETYVIEGERDSGIICLNGAAARLVKTGDCVIIMAFCCLEEKELSDHSPIVVFVDEKNHISRIDLKEKHGLLS